MPVKYKKIISNTLQKIGHSTPNIPKIRAIGNKILWPIHRSCKLGGGVTNVLDFKMKLDPSECVDRNLWFTPHLYDKKEIDFAITYLNDKKSNKKRVFIDAGANIGFWSLSIAQNVRNSRIISIEANPATATILEENILLNKFSNIEIVNKGLGGSAGNFKLFCGNHANRGGDSFKHKHKNATEVLVEVITLEMLCEQLNLDSIDFMKMDIEGMEIDVLEPFFLKAHIGLYPRYICLEHSHSSEIDTLMSRHGYKAIKKYRENSIYRYLEKPI